MKNYNFKGYFLFLSLLGLVTFFSANGFCNYEYDARVAFLEVSGDSDEASADEVAPTLNNEEDSAETEANDDSAEKKEEVNEPVKKKDSTKKRSKKKKRRKKKKTSKVLAEGDKFFSFTRATVDKSEINIEDFVGNKIIILKFGSIYCSSCISSIPKLAKLQDKYKEEIQIIEVNLDIYGRGRVRKFYKGLRNAINYPIVVDKGLKISRQYGVTTLPTNVVIDKEGIIKYISRGYSELEEENLENVINSILDKGDALPKKISSDKLSILMPLNITKTFQGEVYVVGRIKTPGVKIELTLNGGSKQTQLATKEMFYFRTILSLGSNYLELKIPGKNGEPDDTKAIVVFREAKFGGAMEPVPFPEYKFHTKENESLCSECHELVPPSTDEDQGIMITGFCLKCHGEMVAEKYVHGPISVGGCLPCHDFNSKPNRYELKAQRAELCYICHAEKKEELEKANLHGPMAAGICVLCHNPHSAPYKFQLQRWGGELCYFCHSDLRRFQATAHQHQPYKNGECTKCHGPHSSDSEQYFLLKPDITELCYSCHSEESMENHRHKVGIVPKKVRLDATRRVDKKGRLICVTCHNPHGDEGEKMLPKNGCADCHKN